MTTVTLASDFLLRAWDGLKMIANKEDDYLFLVARAGKVWLSASDGQQHLTACAPLDDDGLDVEVVIPTHVLLKAMPRKSDPGVTFGPAAVDVVRIGTPDAGQEFRATITVEKWKERSLPSAPLTHGNLEQFVTALRRAAPWCMRSKERLELCNLYVDGDRKLVVGSDGAGMACVSCEVPERSAVLPRTKVLKGCILAAPGRYGFEDHGKQRVLRCATKGWRYRLLTSPVPYPQYQQAIPEDDLVRASATVSSEVASDVADTLRGWSEERVVLRVGDLRVLVATEGGDEHQVFESLPTPLHAEAATRCVDRKGLIRALRDGASTVEIVDVRRSGARSTVALRGGDDITFVCVAMMPSDDLAQEAGRWCDES